MTELHHDPFARRGQAAGPARWPLRGAGLASIAACVALVAGCGEMAGDYAGAYASRGETTANGSGAIAAGTLTAGAWDDNRNYGFFRKYLEEHRELDGRPGFTDDEHDAAHARFSEPAGPRETLDVALVIDTTGSMSDEIRYLQEEIRAISQTIEARYASADQRWALVLYRDDGDAYVTRSFDFTSDLDELRGNLARQGADGGGDFPEAADRALADAMRLGWRRDPGTARLAFWIADAPHHTERAEALASAVREAMQLDVHVYPIASSGIDELTELTMRSAAQLTGGRHLFLTDDSGVGLEHKEPSIPCYFVTKLDAAMLRMVDIEMSGEYHEPAEDQVLRTGGDPRGGQCTLESGDVVSVF